MVAEPARLARALPAGAHAFRKNVQSSAGVRVLWTRMTSRALGAERGCRLCFGAVLALALCATSCSRIFGSKTLGGRSVTLAGIAPGMTEAEVEAACAKRAIKQIIRRSYGGFDAKGQPLPSTPSPVAAASGEQRFLAHMTCGSSAGLTDVTFPPNGSEVRAVVIRHDDNEPVEKSLAASVKALSDEFGEPDRRASDKIAHSGLDKLSLEWVVPKGARDCRDLLKKADEPKLEIPEDCGFTYTTEIFSQGDAVTLSKSSLSNVAEMVRGHQRFLAELYAKQ